MPGGCERGWPEMPAEFVLVVPTGPSGGLVGGESMKQFSRMKVWRGSYLRSGFREPDEKAEKRA